MDDDSLKKSVSDESPKEAIARQEKGDKSQPNDLHQRTFAHCGGNPAALSPDKPSNTRVCNCISKIPYLTIT